MSIITLTSDWGLKSHYIGAVKGTILSILPEVTIVDISHEIIPFDINHASYVIKNCYKNFPKASVHIIGINTEASIKTPHTAVLIDGHYFVGADNGIFSLISEGKPDKIVELNITQDSDYFTFPSRDVFAKAACHLAKGSNIEKLGIVKDSLCQQIIYPKPVVQNNLIKGAVIYIDSYENVITNVSESLFKEIGKTRPFTIIFNTQEYKIKTISKSYSDKNIPLGEMLALFGSTGYLEIAQREGNASSQLGLKISDSVRIEFE